MKIGGDTRSISATFRNNFNRHFTAMMIVSNSSEKVRVLFYRKL